MVEDGAMSNLGPLGGANPMRVPTPPRGDTIARYATYLEAQRAVDYLSDQAFPVQFVTIVGTGLRMVERVTGRLTFPKVAGASALSGAWFGLFVGLVLSLFGGGTAAVVPAAVLFGAGFGILFGIISYSLTGGRRDFTSSSQIVASEYEVLCLPEQAGRARELLGRLHARGEVHALAGPAPGAGAGAGPYGPPPYGQQPSPYGQPPSLYGQPPAGQDYPPQPPPYQRPDVGQERPVEPEPAVTGPTYGEMIERQRREREATERARREREAAEQWTAQQRAADQPAEEPTIVRPVFPEPTTQQPPVRQGPDSADESPDQRDESRRQS
jgi:hypothetical protein